MEKEEIGDLLEFLQSNYHVDGYYYSNKSEPIKMAQGGNQISHQEIIEKYTEYRQKSSTDTKA